METDIRHEVPLFMLGTVLFPGGDLPLRVFEPRYTDMVANAMRTGNRFAIAAIAEGREVGEAAVPSGVVTEVDIVDFEPGDAGSLRIVVRGLRKLRVERSRVQADKLVLGTASALPAEPEIGVPAAHADTVALLRTVLEKTQEWPTGQHAWRDDAAWIGGRLVERLPIDLAGKQQLLEMNDPLARLGVLAEVTALMQA
ncbi:MAG: LON peptidase substrate-binding domain-containing protein [Pseudomonadota bacterium]